MGSVTRVFLLHFLERGRAGQGQGRAGPPLRDSGYTEALTEPGSSWAPGYCDPGPRCTHRRRPPVPADTQCTREARSSPARPHQPPSFTSWSSAQHPPRTCRTQLEMSPRLGAEDRQTAQFGETCKNSLYTRGLFVCFSRILLGLISLPSHSHGILLT